MSRTWEYAVETFTINNVAASFDNGLAHQLNLRGELGWELVEVACPRAGFQDAQGFGEAGGYAWQEYRTIFKRTKDG